MAFISLRSVNISEHFIRHRNFLADISPIVSDLDKNDATFELVGGLADPNHVSIRSVNFPMHFLRHQGFRLKLHESNPPLGGAHDQLLAKDATFIRRPGLADPSAISFESVNFPNHFIRHRNFQLFIDPFRDEDLFKKDATFRIDPGFVSEPHGPG